MTEPEPYHFDQTYGPMTDGDGFFDRDGILGDGNPHTAQFKKYDHHLHLVRSHPGKIWAYQVKNPRAVGYGPEFDKITNLLNNTGDIIPGGGLSGWNTHNWSDVYLEHYWYFKNIHYTDNGYYYSADPLKHHSGQNNGYAHQLYATDFTDPSENLMWSCVRRTVENEHKYRIFLMATNYDALHTHSLFQNGLKSNHTDGATLDYRAGHHGYSFKSLGSGNRTTSSPEFELPRPLEEMHVTVEWKLDSQHVDKINGHFEPTQHSGKTDTGYNVPTITKTLTIHNPDDQNFETIVSVTFQNAWMYDIQEYYRRMNDTTFGTQEFQNFVSQYLLGQEPEATDSLFAMNTEFERVVAVPDFTRNTNDTDYVLMVPNGGGGGDDSALDTNGVGGGGDGDDDSGGGGGDYEHIHSGGDPYIETRDGAVYKITGRAQPVNFLYCHIPPRPGIEGGFRVEARVARLRQKDIKTQLKWMCDRLRGSRRTIDRRTALTQLSENGWKALPGEHYYHRIRVSRSDGSGVVVLVHQWPYGWHIESHGPNALPVCDAAVGCCQYYGSQKARVTQAVVVGDGAARLVLVNHGDNPQARCGIVLRTHKDLDWTNIIGAVIGQPVLLTDLGGPPTRISNFWSPVGDHEHIEGLVVCA